jgi:MEMO1 family protein
MIKLPAVAGVFYPINPTQLTQMLDQFLQDAANGEKPPKAMIAPHAGYRYSGSVAASIYARLKNAEQPITRVVLIGPAHRLAFDGLAISRADAFNTPLGNIAVDKKAIEKLTHLPFVQCLEQAHAHEHSLEVQLPFLQTLLGNFKIVPVLAGKATPEQVAQAIDLLWGGEETLIVISSDLSHYHDYATARRLDQSTSQLIETQQYEQLTFESACGRIPVSGLLKLARDKGLAIKTVDLRNSGDTSGDKARVVGYGAYAVG